MFDFLKKKIAGFVDTIAGKKEDEAKKPLPGPEKIPEGRKEAAVELPAAPAAKAGPKREIPARGQPAAKPKPAPPVQKPERRQVKAGAKEQDREIPRPKEEAVAEKKETRSEARVAGPEVPEPKKEERVKLSLITRAKSLFSGEVELSEKDISSALEDFEIGLLEGDVAFEVAEQIKGELRNGLVGKKVKKGDLQRQVSSAFFNSIKSIMSENTGAPLIDRVRMTGSRPVKIMFTGPNGSGKTTTIAKIANLLKKNGFSVVIAAADTFRAAAIEQMEIHGSTLGVKVIKGKYGADPTSVAFDAVNHAKAHSIDVVLIDTAGRQETNLNLLSELKKMVRVISPEIKIYVGESIAGNAVIEQVDTFNKELNLDGVILTKLDCDAKGGTVISISKVTHVPVIYLATGQAYEDLEVFDPDRIARNIAG